MLRCTLKTARLFEAAAQLGAHAGGRPQLPASRSPHSVRRSGLAFQLADDVLDVIAPTEQTGKTRGADLLDGTVNLPLIVAAERDATCGISTSRRSTRRSRPARSATASSPPARQTR